MKPIKPYAQQTPRERFIDSAKLYMKIHKVSAHLALEASYDSVRSCKQGTYGYEEAQYYKNITDNALERLIKATERG